jgi:Uma2 family endonuclease
MVKVEATGWFTYPDLSIVCPPVERATAPIEVVLNSKVLMEVLLPSTEIYDRNVKFRHYQQIASVQEILLVREDEPVIEHYRRQSADVWELTMISGLENEVTLRSVVCQLPLAQVYANVESPPPQHPLPPAPKLT